MKRKLIHLDHARRCGRTPLRQGVRQCRLAARISSLLHSGTEDVGRTWPALTADPRITLGFELAMVRESGIT